MGKNCPLCKKVNANTLHHEKIVNERFMICLECHKILNRYYSKLEVDFEYKYKYEDEKLGIKELEDN